MRDVGRPGRADSTLVGKVITDDLCIRDTTQSGIVGTNVYTVIGKISGTRQSYGISNGPNLQNTSQPQLPARNFGPLSSLLSPPLAFAGEGVTQTLWAPHLAPTLQLEAGNCQE